MVEHFSEETSRFSLPRKSRTGPREGLMELSALAVLVALGLCAGSPFARGEEEFYKIDTFPDRGLKLEVGALTKLSDGRIMLGTRTGDVFIAEGAYDNDPGKIAYKRYARGLAQPLGLLEHEGSIYTAQRGELTRMEDTDGDGKADLVVSGYTGYEPGWGTQVAPVYVTYGPTSGWERDENTDVVLVWDSADAVGGA